MWGRSEPNFDGFWFELLTNILINLRERRSIMWFSPIFDRFVLKDTASHMEKSPVTVILRALMEVVLVPSKLDELFEQTAQTGYTRELLLSNLVKMMSLVVCSVRQSIGSVYKAMSEEIGVSKTAVYDKQGSSRTLC